jgi:F0F1-type ATP synthase assembly protein I
MAIAYRGLTLGSEFVLPALGGLALDRWWGTLPWFTLAGTALGFAVGMLHLLRFARESSRSGS